MKTYIIHWNLCKYAVSKVHANDKKEAKERANSDNDYDWKEHYEDEDWLISSIQEIDSKP